MVHSKDLSPQDIWRVLEADDELCDDEMYDDISVFDDGVVDPNFVTETCSDSNSEISELFR